MGTISISAPPSSALNFGLGIGMKVRPENESSPPAVKPKQSKSRNGCVTCKAKRLKCDETKPTCQQCYKRGVPCGGYRKDFKWRPFEESAIVGKGLKPARKGAGVQKKKSPSPPRESPRIEKRKPLRPNSQDIPVSFPDQAFNLDSVFILPEDTCGVPPEMGALQFADACVDAADDFDLLLPRSMSPPSQTQDLIALPMRPVIDQSSHDTEDEIEELIRSPPGTASWRSSPALSIASTDSSASFALQSDATLSIHDIFRRPAVSADSPEILLNYFDKQTCGIMSVKDGPRENPWRTLIWPLALDSQALYHAIYSMTAFHISRERPELRVEGMEHMRKSIRFLGQGLSHGNIRQDAALATTLVLAFSEAFDRHISTGIEHLRGARVLLNQALSKASSMGVYTNSFRRLQFLYNVWVYLDVLARLTADDSDGDGNSNLMQSYAPLLPSFEVDPLLGCAGTLFPLIGQAAYLVQRVRRSEKNSVGIISDAMDLKHQLESWHVSEYYDPVEDPSNDIIHCTKTAEAYRIATLLYLHQAVPEIPSPSAHELAEKVMTLLASIPQTSRCCIVHIYPLLAAGCEAIGDEERNWVTHRWESMSSRMRIGNVDKAWQVVKEVWRRRDGFLQSTPQRHTSPPRKFFNTTDWDLLSDGGSPRSSRQDQLSAEMLREYRRGDYGYEVSIKGNLHWLGVMKDWRWEGDSSLSDYTPILWLLTRD